MGIAVLSRIAYIALRIAQVGTDLHGLFRTRTDAEFGILDVACITEILKVKCVGGFCR